MIIYLFVAETENAAYTYLSGTNGPVFQKFQQTVFFLSFSNENVIWEKVFLKRVSLNATSFVLGRLERH